MSSAIKQAASPKAILIAMGGACLLYGFMLGLSLLKGGQMLDALEGKMAAQNINFDRPVLASRQHSDSSRQNVEMVKQEDLSSVIGVPKEPLPPAPYDGLTEESKFGNLPIVGKNKLKPFAAYKKPFVIDIKKPVIAIGVTGLGFSDALSKQALDQLTPQVSLILSAYVDGINDIQKQARMKGYETWLKLPIENKNFPYSDPGSKGVLVGASLKFNQDNFYSILASTAGYAGLAGYTDRAFVDAKPLLNGVLSDAFSRGLGFFEMNARQDSMSGKLAIENRGAHLKASIPLKEQTIAQRFEVLKKLAKRDNSAIGVVEISPAMLVDFQKQVLAAQQEGFQIAPLSALADQF